MVPTFERQWTFKETNLLIKSDVERAIDAGIEATLEARREIESFALKNPDFRWSLEPILIPGQHPRPVKLMLEAGELAGVGPFAAVAGTISQVAAEAIVQAGARNALVENGGDIAVIGERDFRVGVFAGGATSSGRLGFLVKSEDLPLGICTSSGTVGHSMSLGDSDAAVVFADGAPLADAAATSIANDVRGADEKNSIEEGLKKAKSIPRIRGCMILRGKHVGTWGKIPELTELVSPKPHQRKTAF